METGGCQRSHPLRKLGFLDELWVEARLCLCLQGLSPEYKSDPCCSAHALSGHSPSARDTGHFLPSHTLSFQSQGQCHHSSWAPGLHKVTCSDPCRPPQLQQSCDRALPTILCGRSHVLGVVDTFIWLLSH